MIDEIYNYPEHDYNACEALKEYEIKSQKRDELMYEQIIDRRGRQINGRRLNTPPIRMISISYIARKYNTTVQEMRSHWGCIDLDFEK